jgi:hypothetical protein
MRLPAPQRVPSRLGLPLSGRVGRERPGRRTAAEPGAFRASAGGGQQLHCQQGGRDSEKGRPEVMTVTGTGPRQDRGQRGLAPAQGALPAAARAPQDSIPWAGALPAAVSLK